MSSTPLLDQHYTPATVARELLGAVSLDRVHLVGDFAAGDGELLRAAQERWTDATLVAADIDLSTVSRLRKRHPTWSTSRCDFTNPRSRAKARGLRRAHGTFDVIALNPPFSFRGGTKRSVRIGESVVSCSPPLAFVADAVMYLRAGGQLVAILPHGTLTSEKDRMARGLLAETYGFEVVRTCARGTFSSCSPRTAIVRIGTGAVSEIITPSVIPITDKCIHVGEVSLRRGRVPVGAATPAGLPLVHTTDMRDGALMRPKRFAGVGGELVRGPSVLIPRVGKPTATKVVLMESDCTPAVLSDCVLAVECLTPSAARILQEALVENWAAVEAAYGGTCARYLTLASLRQLLIQLGVGVLAYGSSIRTRTSLYPIGNGIAYPMGDGSATEPNLRVSARGIQEKPRERIRR
jgi:hypothetical protein